MILLLTKFTLIVPKKYFVKFETVSGQWRSNDLPRAKTPKAKEDIVFWELCQVKPCHLNVETVFHSMLLLLLEINLLMEMNQLKILMTCDINGI